MNLQKILNKQRGFVRARAWEVFHSPKNIASALIVECAELLEIFQWMETEESRKPNRNQKVQIEEEIADVFYYLLRLCDLLEIDLEEAFWKKMKKNARKYPARLAKNSAAKYTELKKSKPRRR